MTHYDLPLGYLASNYFKPVPTCPLIKPRPIKAADVQVDRRTIPLSRSAHWDLGLRAHTGLHVDDASSSH